MNRVGLSDIVGSQCYSYIVAVRHYMWGPEGSLMHGVNQIKHAAVAHAA